MEFRISTDREAILQSEPLELELSLANVSTEEVIGFLTVSPIAWRTKIRYRRVGAWEMTTLSTGIRFGMFDPIVKVRPGEATEPTSFLMCFDAGVGRSPFFEPGDYEIVAEFRPDPSSDDVVLRSNMLFVKVYPPSGGDVAALAAYEDRLVGIVQPEATPWISEESLQEALAFVRQFPASPYERLVRGKAESALRIRLSQRDTPAAARTEYERELKALEQHRY